MDTEEQAFSKMLRELVKRNLPDLVSREYRVKFDENKVILYKPPLKYKNNLPYYDVCIIY